MPITPDKERELLNAYHIETLYPDAWPQDHEEASSSEEDDELAPKHKRQLSKYRSIGRHVSRTSNLSGTQKVNGEDSLVQKDERDPLGQHHSVIAELRRRGLPIDDVKLRNRFMLSSTSFSPQMFLSNVHQDATTDDLLRGLEFLSRSIDEKSASLKVLVESNFERFVRAKSTIDNVYTEMRSHGTVEIVTPRIPHTRHTSRNTAHFRNTSNPFSPKAPQKKTALTKETEFGVSGLKAPLLEVAVKAEEVWGPALGGREKENGLKSIIATMEHKDIFMINRNIRESIVKNDYDSVITEWNKAKKYAEEARNIAKIAHQNQAELGAQDVHQIIVTARMWHEIQQQMETFKQDIWRRLKSTHKHEEDAHMELIGILLQIGVDENPIWQWLSSQILYLRERIVRSFERSRIEIEILRRRAAYAREHAKTNPNYFPSDSPEVTAFWDRASAAMKTLLVDILAEVVEFSESARDFIENKAQKAFPTAVFAAGLEHLSLEPDEVENVQSGTVELITLLRDNVFAFFSDAPVTDLSDLYSPIATPVTPGTPGSKRAFAFDAATVPPPVQEGAWSKFAFWPPGSNALSGAQYLSTILGMVASASAEMANMPVVRAHKSGPESLKTLVGTVRERCMQAVVAAWSPDAEDCKNMELWQRAEQRKDLTTMPAAFITFEEKVLSGMQKIAFPEISSEVVVPPSAKLLQTIRGAFVTSLYKALSGMVENAEKLKLEDNPSDPDGITVSKADSDIDFSNRNVRMLMTLSNLAHLRSEAIPQLISQFESSFTVKLTEETKTIRDVLAQIDARLFQSYVKPIVEKIQSLITRGITDPSWPPSGRPDNARQYIYEVLLSLIYVHAEVSTTATPLTSQILAYLLEQAGVALISAFKARPRYALPALMQATLDVEFLAQTLSNYTTDRASEVQSQIYLVLDERTEQDARAKLEGELPEMRTVLKRLRESTRGQFGCFRRERTRGRENKGSAGGSAGGSGATNVTSSRQ